MNKLFSTEVIIDGGRFAIGFVFGLVSGFFVEFISRFISILCTSLVGYLGQKNKDKVNDKITKILNQYLPASVKKIKLNIQNFISMSNLTCVTYFNRFLEISS